MGQPKLADANIEDYLAIEVAEAMRYEYHNGEVFAMAGGTATH